MTACSGMLVMEHSDIRIGGTFICGEGLWLCTDIGTRTVIAIRIDQAEIETLNTETGARTLRGIDPRVEREWLNGPPYALAEVVFDEDDLEACEPVEDAMP